MAYRNFLGIIGHRWISRFDMEYLQKELPVSTYRILVEFAGDCLELHECDGTERDVERLVVYFKDGTNRVDPDPFTYTVHGPVDATYVAGMARTHFYMRGKTQSHPQTRNEDPAVIRAVRGTARAKLRHHLEATGLDATCVEGPEEPLEILVNAMGDEGRKKLCRILGSLDRDGLKCVVQFRFDMSTVDQLQRLDTEMEFGDLGEVLELTEGEAG